MAGRWLVCCAALHAAGIARANELEDQTIDFADERFARRHLLALLPLLWFARFIGSTAPRMAERFLVGFRLERTHWSLFQLMMIASSP